MARPREVSDADFEGYLSARDTPALSTGDVAEHFGIDRRTARKRLKENSAIASFTIGRTDGWYLKNDDPFITSNPEKPSQIGDDPPSDDPEIMTEGGAVSEGIGGTERAALESLEEMRVALNHQQKEFERFEQAINGLTHKGALSNPSTSVGKLHTIAKLVGMAAIGIGLLTFWVVAVYPLNSNQPIPVDWTLPVSFFLGTVAFLLKAGADLYPVIEKRSKDS